MPTPVDYIRRRPSVTDTSGWQALEGPSAFTASDFRQVLQVKHNEFCALVRKSAEWQKAMLLAGDKDVCAMFSTHSRLGFRLVNTTTLQWLQDDDFWGSSERFGCSSLLIPPSVLKRAVALVVKRAKAAVEAGLQEVSRPHGPILLSNVPADDSISLPRHIYNDLRTAVVCQKSPDGLQAICRFTIQSLMPDDSPYEVIDAWDVPLQYLLQKLYYLSYVCGHKKETVEAHGLYVYPDGVAISTNEEWTSILLDHMRGHFQDAAFQLCICFGAPARPLPMQVAYRYSLPVVRPLPLSWSAASDPSGDREEELGGVTEATDTMHIQEENLMDSDVIIRDFEPGAYSERNQTLQTETSLEEELERPFQTYEPKEKPHRNTKRRLDCDSGRNPLLEKRVLRSAHRKILHPDYSHNVTGSKTGALKKISKAKRETARQKKARIAKKGSGPERVVDSNGYRMSDTSRWPQRLDLVNKLFEKHEPAASSLLRLLHKRRKIVVIAGAGISKSAGIPDFRSKDGLFKTLQKKHGLKISGQSLFNASVYSHEDSTAHFHDMVRELKAKAVLARPTAFHDLLSLWQREGRLLRLYTQNVDGIDTSLPGLGTQVPLPRKKPWPRTIQVHGGLDYMTCVICHATLPLDPSIFKGSSLPPCQACEDQQDARQGFGKRPRTIGGFRPRMSLYNEVSVDEDAIGACVRADLKSRPDAVLVVGTTLTVPGIREIAKNMCEVAKNFKNGDAIWLNPDPEPRGNDFADIWTLVIKGTSDAITEYL